MYDKLVFMYQQNSSTSRVSSTPKQQHPWQLQHPKTHTVHDERLVLLLAQHLAERVGGHEVDVRCEVIHNVTGAGWREIRIQKCA